MLIVDKYGLAEAPAGTPFFILNNKYWKMGSDINPFIMTVELLQSR